MLSLHKQLDAARTPTAKTAMSVVARPLPYGRGTDRIIATGRRIDEFVYELYGLSDEEIRIVEEAKHG